MIAHVLAFLAGISTTLVFAQLPSLRWGWVIFLGSVGLGALLKLWLRSSAFQWVLLALMFIAGFGWMVIHVGRIMQWSLPVELEGKNLLVMGKINSIPEVKNNNLSFVFALKQLQVLDAQQHVTTTETIKKPVLLRLSWYAGSNSLHVGDQWQLLIRLKPPRGFLNEVGFDYQKWLCAQGIRATGYVINNGPNRFLTASPIDAPIDAVRTHLSRAVAAALSNRPLCGLIQALAVGVRTSINEAQWKVLRGTGTNHLFAIAGLHIGFVLSVVYFLVGLLWPRLGRLALLLPTTQVAAFCGLCAAVTYSALAGFSLPTQRAVFMTTVLLLATFFRKNLASWSSWSVALILLLLCDPLTVLSESFWLSFSAVALIIYGMGGRIHAKGWWWHWGRVQWVMAVGLIPISLLFFQQVALTSFIANAIAIPWTGFIILPLSLLGDLLWLVWPSIADFFWRLAEYALEGLWPILQLCAAKDGLQWQTYIYNPLILITAIITVILFLAPRGIPSRWLSLVWGLPLVFYHVPGPKNGELWFTLLDVGQGVTAIARTQTHVLIYAVGSHTNARLDSTAAVVIPYLQYHRLHTVDVLLTNDVMDQPSMMQSIQAAGFSVRQIFTPAQTLYPASVCMAGQNWQWDGVGFQILYSATGNKSGSCMLRMTAGTHSILLTGNIDQQTEDNLVRTTPTLLASTILLAPRSGNTKSSTANFVAAVRPQFVLFATGYHNRFGLPDQGVVARYKMLNALVYNTAEVGAITFKLTGNSPIKLPQTYSYKFWDGQKEGR